MSIQNNPLPGRLERSIAETEYTLSIVSATVIGAPIGAALKILLGTIQVIGGLIAATVIGLFKDNNFRKRAFAHVPNGFANILAAFIEAIPGLGTYIFYRRYKREDAPKNQVALHLSYQETRQGHAFFVGYKILEDNHVKRNLPSYGFQANENTTQKPMKYVRSAKPRWVF